MVQFYLSRLEAKSALVRQSYLDTTVVAKYRDAVRSAWNEAHPEQKLK